MVSKPTVLVVGAGGSSPYGYPLGRELVDSIIDELSPGKINISPFAGRMGELGCSLSMLREFRRHLILSHRTSIDRFLSQWKQYVEVGKLAIAAMLVPKEESEMGHRESDWYRHLFSRVSDNFDEGKKEKLTILTFNYDRSLDQYLYSAFKYSYALSDVKLRETLASLEIIHMHGSLSALPFEETKIGHERAYGDFENPNYIRGAAQCIKIINEQREDDPAFARAHNAFLNAEHICFLGFGYDTTNVRRLLKGDWHKKRKYTSFIGSGLGFTGSEASKIVEQFGGVLKIVDGESDCLGVLRHHTYILS